MFLAIDLRRNERAIRAPKRLPLLDLAPGGACRGQPITRLPVSSYLAISPLPRNAGRFVSVALSLRLPSLAVNQRPALWSPDFPRRIFQRRSRPIFLHYQSCILTRNKLHVNTIGICEERS